jgi:hypothetical protein
VISAVDYSDETWPELTQRVRTLIGWAAQQDPSRAVELDAVLCAREQRMLALIPVAQRVSLGQP